jgi:threonine/homoserine/homoserine lactone efflux protein
MMEIVVKGIITGLLLSTLVGATFFMLIETSMTRGFRAALWFDAGVVLCDALIIFSVYFFASWINNTVINNQYFNTAGGIIFMAFGINYIFSRKKETKITLTKTYSWKTFANGFFINLMNPSVLLFWMGSMAVSLNSFTHNGRESFIYFASALCVMVIFDILKAYFAYRLGALIHTRILRMTYIFSGLLLIGLGLWLILD